MAPIHLSYRSFIQTGYCQRYANFSSKEKMRNTFSAFYETKFERVRLCAAVYGTLLCLTWHAFRKKTSLRSCGGFQATFFRKHLEKLSLPHDIRTILAILVWTVAVRHCREYLLLFTVGPFSRVLLSDNANKREADKTDKEARL